MVKTVRDAPGKESADSVPLKGWTVTGQPRTGCGGGGGEEEEAGDSSPTATSPLAQGQPRRCAPRGSRLEKRNLDLIRFCN